MAEGGGWGGEVRWGLVGWVIEKFTRLNRPFPSSPGPLFQKTRVGAQPLIWKSFFILMQIKLIFIRKVVHLASFWKWGFSELGSGLFLDLLLGLWMPTPQARKQMNVSHNTTFYSEPHLNLRPMRNYSVAQVQWHKAPTEPVIKALFSLLRPHENHSG